MRDKELTGASPCLAVCRILIATFQRLMNKPHSHKTKKSLVEPSPRGCGAGWEVIRPLAHAAWSGFALEDDWFAGHADVAVHDFDEGVVDEVFVAAIL